MPSSTVSAHAAPAPARAASLFRPLAAHRCACAWQTSARQRCALQKLAANRETANRVLIDPSVPAADLQLSVSTAATLAAAHALLGGLLGEAARTSGVRSELARASAPISDLNSS